MRNSLIAIALLVAALPLAAQETPNLARGFAQDKVFNYGDIDNVNLFNGNLVVSIPVGPKFPVSQNLSWGFSLTYSGNVWDYSGRERIVCDPNCREVAPWDDLTPSAVSNAGIGWTFGMGYLLPVGSSGLPAYVGTDGAQHAFYDTLRSEPYVAGVQYTRDNTFLRLKTYPGPPGYYEIEFPGGEIHRFDANGRLTQMRDRYNNTVSIAYTFDGSGNVTKWTITDSTTPLTGRTATVNLVHGNGLAQVVSSVVLPAFNGTTATYNFGYTDNTFWRKCSDNPDPQLSPQLAAATLSSLALPVGGVTFQMPAYEPGVACIGGSTFNASGSLDKLILPTGGVLQYTWQPRVFDSGSGPKTPFTHAVGIAKRTKTDFVNTAAAAWTYAVAQLHGSFDVLQTVQDPAGNITNHYFDGCISTTGACDRNLYGLPFTTNAADTNSGKYLSTKLLGGGTTDVEDTYVTYTAEVISPAPPDNFSREASHRVVYPQDSANWTNTEYSNYDTLGHFRQAVGSGSLGMTGNRTSITDYNPTSTMPSVGSPWLLDTFDQQSVSEGAATAYQQFCFDPTYGVLNRKRILASASAGSADLLTIVSRDATGNTQQEKYYGGDNQSIATTSLCALAAPASPVYQINHTWANGRLATSQYNAFTSFYFENYAIDAASGLVSSSTDPAGLKATYKYDSMGRVTEVRPAHDAPTEYLYTAGTTTAAPNQVDIQRTNAAKTTILAENKVQYDGFGRVWRHLQKMPNATWSTQETDRDGLGRKTQVSEQETTPTHWTTFGNYDEFGRAKTITAPDGHAVTMDYHSGVATVDRTVKVATTRTGEVAETTTEAYDSFGRLSSVKEANLNTTTYGYDVGNRLATVAMGSENRTFTYDQRGFLTSEAHPELGASGSGSGTISYRYDTRGHVIEKTSPLHNLDYVYDGAERLLSIADHPGTGNGYIWKEFTYDTSNLNGNSNAKLVVAKRHNHIVLAGAPYEAIFAQHYVYGGLEGRVSSKKLVWENNSPALYTFQTLYSFDTLGNLLGITYPSCSVGTGYTCSNPARNLTETYTNGFLTNVKDASSATTYSNTIGYAPNGMVTSLTWPGSVSDTITPDPFGIPRPASISTTGVTPAWSSGTYQYDGAGNIKAIGSDWAIYDPLSRVIEGSAQNGTTRQDYAFDIYGNMTSISTNGGSSTPLPTSTKNRLTSATIYDNDGNMTTYGSNTRDFDAMDMMTRMNDTVRELWYLYDADDERVWVYKNTTGESWWDIRDLSGHVLRQYYQTGTTTTFTKDWMYRGSQLSASTTSTVTPNTPYTFFHLDHLGTPRLISNGASGEAHAYYPFGMESTCVGTATETMEFTGHERDMIPGSPCSANVLDYMHARYYGSALGRFVAVDLHRGNAALPQEWNRYSYVTGRPVVRWDPSGLADEYFSLQQIPALGTVAEGLRIAGESFFAHPSLTFLKLGEGIHLGPVKVDILKADVSPDSIKVESKATAAHVGLGYQGTLSWDFGDDGDKVKLEHSGFFGIEAEKEKVGSAAADVDTDTTYSITATWELINAEIGVDAAELARGLSVVNQGVLQGLGELVDPDLVRGAAQDSTNGALPEEGPR